MKKLLSLILSVLFCAAVFSGCGNPDKEDNEEPINVVISEGYDRYDITEASGRTVGGFGAQIDTDLFMPWNLMTADEEKMIADRVSEMNLQYTRIKMFPEFFERANDNSDYDSFDYNAAGVDMNSAEMLALYKVLDLCEANGIRVDLSWYDCWTTFVSYDGRYTGTWLGYSFEEAGSWASAPKTTDESGHPFAGYEEYAENIYAALYYLTEVKGYTCIYGFSFIAEMFVNGAGVISWADYVECCEVIEAKLKRENFRDKIKFIGTSNNNRVVRYFDEEQEPLEDIYDLFGVGNYFWDNDDDIDGARAYFESIMEVCDSYGKELTISEFGTSGPFTDATTRVDIDDYDAGLYLARFMIAAVENGVTTLNHYVLSDTYFTNQYVHRLGLWLYRTEGWKAHPAYYFWAMVCKYSEIGSEIFTIPTADEDVMMIAFKQPDGKWSYMIANNATERKRVAVVNTRSDRPRNMNVYAITESKLPENRACVLPAASDTVSGGSGVVHVSLPALSFTVVSDK